ncbi:MAG TPA: PEP-CTERM sorting domain-containing protein [Roseiarcus sp.]|jgi:hypothetical protein
MSMTHARFTIPLSLLGCLCAMPAAADAFSFSTGKPDGRIGTLSRPASAGGIQTETADDFILGHATSITKATFYGLIPTGSSVSQVEIEFYHVFPGDSNTVRTPNVPTRKNSPGDVEIGSATRDSAAGNLTFGSSLVSSSFNVLNTVVNGINPFPDQFTGGEGLATGEEVLINVDFTTPVDLPADHYFFRPEALLSSGNFLFLSAAGPSLFTGDLQSWTRNDNLAPDWLRIGTDITQQGPFDAAFSLTGTVIPEPSTWAMMLLGFAGLGFAAYRHARKARPASA